MSPDHKLTIGNIWFTTVLEYLIIRVIGDNRGAFYYDIDTDQQGSYSIRPEYDDSHLEKIGLKLVGNINDDNLKHLTIEEIFDNYRTLFVEYLI